MREQYPEWPPRVVVRSAVIVDILRALPASLAARVTRRGAIAAIIAIAALGAFALRIWDIQDRFWMLEDQIRDWEIVLQPFWRLPLVGPPTHVHGYTIGPAFYWILWSIRVTIGPFFENLPHAGGIGQAALQTAADTLLMVAVWRRTRLPWVAAAMFVVVVTSSFDLALAGLVWNPTMGSTLAKMATALVLLNWHRGSLVRLGVTAAVAWSSVHAYTGAVFVALCVLLALVVDTWQHAGRGAAVRALAVVAATVAALQIPYLVHQISRHFGDPAMSAVSGGIAEILSGRAAPLWGQSIRGYRDAVHSNEVAPWTFAHLGWALIAGGAIVAWRFRRDPPLLIMILLPQIGAMVGFAFFLGPPDSYYYLSLMPAAVLTILLPIAAIPWPRARHAVGLAVLLAAIVTIPSRVQLSTTICRLPEYRILVAASRTLRNLHQPLRAIVTDFPLPPTCNPGFLYFVLGGTIDRSSPWVAVISANGQIHYINNDINKARRGGA